MDDFVGFIILVAFIGMFVAAGYIGGAKFVDASQVLVECEKTLPRNQQCELYAKPVEVK